MNTRDRLYEMKQLSGMEEGRGSQENVSKNQADTSLEHFLQNVDSIRHVLMMLNRDREAIQKQQEDSLAAGCADQVKCRMVNDHSDQFIKQARVIRTRLRTASDELENYPENRFGKGKARHEQVRSLITSFQTIMTKFGEDQAEYKQKAGRKIAAYLRKQNIQVSDDRIDDVIENGSLFSLTRNINLGVEQKKALFDDVQSRASDILIVEQQIREVEELFEELHQMVQQQGDTIDRIETSVLNSDEYVKRGNKQVKEAVELHRKSRKWKIVICIGLIVLVFVLLGVVRIFLPF